MNNFLSTEEIVFGLEIFFFLTFFLYIFVWLEMKVHARSENRHGPNRISAHGGRQLFADLLKLLRKEKSGGNQSSQLFTFFLSILYFLPYLFCFLLIKLFTSENASSLDVLSLFFLIIFSIVIENIIPFFQKSPEEKIVIKRTQIKNLMAYSVLFLSTATLFVLAGDAVGFKGLILSPAGLAACIITFFITLYLSDSPPLGNELSTVGGIQRLLSQLSKRLWTISLSLFWALSFFIGNINSPLDFAIAVILSSLVCFSILCVNVALPASRQEMALNILTKYFLPFAFCTLLIELIWVVIA